MKGFRQLVLVTTIASTLVMGGCSNSSGSSSDGTSINGSASAPSGTVAHLEPTSPFEIVMNFLVTPVAAAITGLEPVGGATVELIRVDNEGNQIGDVLAKTVTSITGDYELVLPQNVNLAGNLIVRITGSNNTQMRAQVVEQEVDITPVSEFVLRKFIEQGADLDQLVVIDVVKLGGKVEEFDFTAGANLEEMLATLEAQVGELVENQIAVISADPADASAIAGDYASSDFIIDMEDTNEDNYGTIVSGIMHAQFQLTDAGDGIVDITLISEEDAEAGLYGTTLQSSGLWYDVSVEEENETFQGTFSNKGLLSVEGAFEEDIYDNNDGGIRWLPVTYNLQRVKDKGLFFLLSNEAAVEYATVDTDGDGTKDAIDPDQPTGDKASRNLQVFARKPANMTDSDLTGEFGRVYLASNLNAGGSFSLATEVNTVTFNGDGSLISNAGSGRELEISGSGTAYATQSLAQENLSISVAADGDITAVGGSPADGYVGDGFDFLAFAESEGSDASHGSFDKTLMVKLPTTGVTVSGKTYRVMSMSMFMNGAGDGTSQFELFTTQFNTFITMASETEGAFEGKISEVEKSSLGGNMTATRETVSGSVSVNVANNGATTVEIDDGSGDGTAVLEGYFNEDASLGVFTEYWQPASGNPDELGIAVLIEVTP